LSDSRDITKSDARPAEPTENNISRFMKKYDINNYDSLLKKSTENIEWYWDAVNEDLHLKWFNKYDKVIENQSDSGFINSRWFVNGKCNIISNVIDKNLIHNSTGIAYIFEDEGGNVTRISFDDLDKQVNRVAAALLSIGVKKGDVIGIYLPMIPEAIFSILACSKIGAIHTTIFSGYGSRAVHSRLVDSNAKILITNNKMNRKGKPIDLQQIWYKAVEDSKISKVITIDESEPHSSNILLGYRELLESLTDTFCETQMMDSEDPLFILYTSGTTGAPKGTIHVHGGFMVVAAQQTAYTIDMTARDILFWYADIGWITGQTWVVYGAPIVGGTAVIYNGALTYPKPYTWCDLISRHEVSIFGASPTAIRSLSNDDYVKNYEFPSLRTLTVTGEPMNKNAYFWYDEFVGRGRCPIINLSGGTEIGGAIVSTSPHFSSKPCSVGKPLPGFDATVFDDSGNETSDGYLVIRKPWPSMTRGILNNSQKFIDTYWSKYRNIWYHGDLVEVDSDGYWYITGRADDLIKVSGHRIGPAELEDAIMTHKAVMECLVVGLPDRVTGQAIFAFVVLKKKNVDRSKISQEITKHVVSQIGKFACPKNIRFVKDLPKTNTGKLLRRRFRANVKFGTGT
jgi:acetyl-CoA synthetase